MVYLGESVFESDPDRKGYMVTFGANDNSDTILTR